MIKNTNKNKRELRDVLLKDKCSGGMVKTPDRVKRLAKAVVFVSFVAVSSFFLLLWFVAIYVLKLFL